MAERASPRGIRWFGIVLVVLGCVAPGARADAQTGGSQILTLRDAIELARRNYPLLKEMRARAQGAEEGVGLAHTAYLPRLDALWQTNRATTNNVFGLLLPQSVIPAISGPVLGTTTSDSVWGSAGGVLLSWQAVDFGVRKGNEEAARAQATVAQAQSALTELDVTAAAADAFLTVLAADEGVRAARANVDRLRTFSESVRTLVRNQLRPGADESRADAELSIADNQLSLAIQTAAIARAGLAEAIGEAGTAVALDAAALAQLPSPPPTDTAAIETHPAVRAAAAAIETARAREQAVARAYAPRIDLQSAFSGRGTGADVPGQPPGGNGLGLEVGNWAVGVTVTFSVFEGLSVNARKRVEAQNELAERARHEQAVQKVATERARAQALMTSAAEIARRTPLELKAAADAESLARARYASGLATATEVADSQRLLAQAEADNAVARLSAWRALLAAAQAAGDLTPFLERLRP